MRVKAFVLGVVLTWFVALAPFRLLYLGAQTFRYAPAQARLSTGQTAYWDALRLEGRLEAMGWTVGYVGGLNVMGQQAYGVTSPQDHTLKVDETLSWDARYAVLAHEGGHTLAPGWMAMKDHECFAEGVSYLVAHDAASEHARYLSALRWTCLGVYLTEFPAVYTAAALLSE